MTEKEYRADKALSYSAIKVFRDSYKNYYKKFILGEYIEQELTTSIMLGSLVDCKLFSSEEFDNRYTIASINKPKGQMGEFCDELYKNTLKYVNSFGELQIAFVDIFQESLEVLKKEDKFKGKTIEHVLKLFKEEKENEYGILISPEMYYSECRSNFGKITVDAGLLQIADKIMESLQNSEYTREVINQQNTSNIEICTQCPIFFDWITGVKCKALFDKLLIDHKEQTIKVFDLKVSYTIDNFEDNYFKSGYWLQAGFYFQAAKELQKSRPELKDYKIGFNFIVADSSLSSIPVIFTTDYENILQSLNGFEYRGKTHKGLGKLISEIKWHTENNIWDRSYDTFNYNGTIPLKKFV
jgi:hypothetical protein